MDSFEQELKITFLQEAQQILDDMEVKCLSMAQAKSETDSKEAAERLFRQIHTLKGSSKVAGFDSIAAFSHQLENVFDKLMKGAMEVTPSFCSDLFSVIDRFRALVLGLRADLSFEFPQAKSLEEDLFRMQSGVFHTPSLGNTGESTGSSDSGSVKGRSPNGEDTIRISTSKLDRLINLIGELKVYREQVSGYKKRLLNLSTPELSSRESAVTWGTDYIDKIVNETHDLSLTLRMMPIRPLFQKMQRVVWDTSTLLKKEVQFIAIGEEVELDKVIVENIGESLAHLFRNAVDHGIESIEERIKKGKPKLGTITMSAQVQENQVLLYISDDGKGLDRESILKKAIEKGLARPGESLTDKEVYDFIFQPGFSTKSEVTDISGRGIGMDAVRAALHEMGGTIEVETEFGAGTTCLICLPLTLSVIQGLVVTVNQQKYIVSLSQVLETVDLKFYQVQKKMDRTPIFNLRGEVIPIIKVAELLSPGLNTKNVQEGIGLIVSMNGKKVVFSVDSLVESLPMALKSLGPELEKVPGVTSSAILSDGEPALVLNLKELAIERRSHGIH